ncbi:hypothetical protein FACS1894190_07960 [Spirochaetia bacterium]|nr:hypothetical protein FACS1894190_07960 [Spirochaetia bacterium]
MKKLFALITVAAVVGTAAFAQEVKSQKDGLFSVGLGAVGSVISSGYTLNYAQDQPGINSLAGETSNSTYKKKSYTNSYGDFGGFVFFDATYAEVDVLFGGSNGLKIGTEPVSEFKLGFAVYGKYPIKMGDKGLKIVPQVGIQYDLVLGAWDSLGKAVADGNLSNGTGIIGLGSDGNSKAYKVIDLSTLQIKIGVGADFPLAGRFYLTGRYIFGIGINSLYEQGIVDGNKKLNETRAEAAKVDYSIFTTSSTLRLGVGFQF